MKYFKYKKKKKKKKKIVLLKLVFAFLAFIAIKFLLTKAYKFFPAVSNTNETKNFPLETH